MRMKIIRSAVSGTLESCDAMVSVEPGDGGLEVELESAVINRFGEHILEVVKETLAGLQVADARVTVNDKGALDCTIRARVQSAVYRAGENAGEIPWEAMAWPTRAD